MVAKRRSATQKAADPVESTEQPMVIPAEEADEVVEVDLPIYKLLLSNMGNFEFHPSRFLGCYPCHQPIQPKPNYETFLKSKGIIPQETEAWIPESGPIRPHWFCPGFFCIYEWAFKAGCKLPFTPLMAEVMHEIDVPPFQIMPMVWKLVHSVENLLC